MAVIIRHLTEEPWKLLVDFMELFEDQTNKTQYHLHYAATSPQGSNTLIRLSVSLLGYEFCGEDGKPTIMMASVTILQPWTNAAETLRGHRDKLIEALRERIQNSTQGMTVDPKLPPDLERT